MNYIFLDIDGVLNCRDYIIENREKLASIDEGRLKILSSLCQEFNCLIILSSSWRSTLKDDLSPKQDYVTYFDGTSEISRGKYMCDLFKQYNITLAGKTPCYSIYETRGDEILYYVNKYLNFPQDKFIILDDEDDNISKYFPDNFIQTNFYADGLTEKHINMAKSILEK